MFYIQSLSGQSQYIPGEFALRRQDRGVESTNRVKAIDPDAPKFTSSATANKWKKLTDRYGQNMEGESRRRLIFAKDLMSSPVITLNSDTALNVAWELITQNRFRHVPVLNIDQMIGIISDRDLLKYRIAHPSSEWSKVKVESIMHKEVLSATADTEIREIAKIMFEERVGCIPIIEPADKSVKGIITRSDILRALLVHAPLEIWG